MELDAEEAGGADHQVRPSGEAEVELEAVANDEEPDIDAGEVRAGVAEERIYACAGVQTSRH